MAWIKLNHFQYFGFWLSCDNSIKKLFKSYTGCSAGMDFGLDCNVCCHFRRWPCVLMPLKAVWFVQIWALIGNRALVQICSSHTWILLSILSKRGYKKVGFEEQFCYTWAENCNLDNLNGLNQNESLSKFWILVIFGQFYPKIVQKLHGLFCRNGLWLRL